MTIRDNHLSTLYRELEPTEPPSALDQSILAAARQEVNGHSSNRRTLARWTIPLSAAAVLVIGVSTLMMMQEQAPQTFRARSEDSAASPTVTAAPTAKDPLREIPTPTPGNAQQFDEIRRQQEVIRRRLEDEAYRQMKTDEAERRVKAEAKGAAKEQDNQDATSNKLKEESLSDFGVSSGMASPPNPTSEPQIGAGAPSPPFNDDGAKLNSADREKFPQPTPSTTASYSAAEEWLKKIAQLKRDGKIREAEIELIAFKHVHPNFPVTRREELLKQFEHNSK